MTSNQDNPQRPYAHPTYKGITVHPLVGGGKSYSVRVYGKHPDGRPKTSSRSFRGPDALRAARAFRAERDRLSIVARTTVDLDRGNELFASTIQTYWDDATLRLERPTLEAYRSNIQAYIRPMLGHLRLREITPEVVHEFKVAIQGMTGASAVQHIMAVLSGILRSAVERGQIDRNPVKEITVPKAKRARLVRPMTWDQVETIRRWFLDRGYIRGALYISLLSQSGARPAEGRRLASDQVLWDQGSIDLIPPQARRQRGQRRARQATNKADGGRSVPLLVALRMDLEAAGVRRMARDRQIIEGESGRAMTPAMYRNFRDKLWNRAMRELGFEFRIYDLRHTFASYMIYTQLYTDVELARMLGHDVRTLHSTYAHIIREAAGRGPLDLDLAIRMARDAHGTHPAGVELPPLVTSRVEITALDRFNDPGRLELLLERAGLTDIQITATEVAPDA